MSIRALWNVILAVPGWVLGVQYLPGRLRNTSCISGKSGSSSSALLMWRSSFVYFCSWEGCGPATTESCLCTPISKFPAQAWSTALLGNEEKSSPGQYYLLFSSLLGYCCFFILMLWYYMETCIWSSIFIEIGIWGLAGWISAVVEMFLFCCNSYQRDFVGFP